MTLTEALKQPAKSLVFLLAITARMRLPHWTQRSAPNAAVWHAPVAADVLKVYEGDAELSEVASLALCQSTNASFYHDYAAGVLNINPAGASPYASASITALIEVRAANVGKEKSVDDKPWPSCVQGTPANRTETDEGFGELPQLSGGSVKLRNQDGRFEILNSRLVTLVKVTALIGVDV